MKTQHIFFAFLLIAFAFPSIAFAQIAGQNPILFTHKNNGWDIAAGQYKPLLTGDITGRLQFRGILSNGEYHPGIDIYSRVTTPVGPTGFGGELRIATGLPLTDRIIVTADGLVGIGAEPDFNLHVEGNTYTSSDFYGRIHIDEDVMTDALPSTYINESNYEYRPLTTFATAPPLTSTATGGTLWTLAPDDDENDVQLFFAENEAFLRHEVAGDAWLANWIKLLTQADLTGTENVLAKFSTGYGIEDSRFYDDGTNIGIGTTGPNPSYFVHIEGSTLVNGTSSFTERLLAQQRVDIQGILRVGDITYANTDYQLAVDGKIICEEVMVRLRGDWPDYVFSTDYSLPTLAEVKTSVEEKGHLPGVPSAATIETEGMEMGEMVRIQQEKIEEIYLYLFEMNERMEELEKENAALKAKLNQR